MSASRAWVSGLLLLAAGTTTPVEAQRPYRSGFWIENGIGTGTIRIGCAGCDEPTALYGESSYLRGGGSLSHRVLWGLEVFSLLNDVSGLNAGDSTLTFENVSISPIVLWYPWQSGLFLKGGVSLTHGEVLLAGTGAPPVTLTSGTGSGVTFGVGFDTPILSWLTITTNFGVYYSALGDVTLQGLPMDDVVASMYNANFAITIR